MNIPNREFGSHRPGEYCASLAAHALSIGIAPQRRVLDNPHRAVQCFVKAENWGPPRRNPLARAGMRPMAPCVAQVRTARRFCLRVLLLAGRLPWLAFLIFRVGLAMVGGFLLYAGETRCVWANGPAEATMCGKASAYGVRR